MGTTLSVIKGDTSSLDNGSHGERKREHRLASSLTLKPSPRSSPDFARCSRGFCRPTWFHFGVCLGLEEDGSGASQVI